MAVSRLKEVDLGHPDSPIAYRSGPALTTAAHKVMKAVFNRFDSRPEESARDMGASDLLMFKEGAFPLILPGIVAAGLFGLTMSYDEFARTTLMSGEFNTLPLDINAAMTQRIRPTLFAPGTVSAIFPTLMIGLFLVIYTILVRRSQ